MSAPVETKVKASTGAAAVASFVVAWIVIQAPALASVADVLQAAIVGVITAVGTAVVGWLTSHTPRSDPAAIRARRGM